ncbi:hypothetical protein [Nocardia exalbida]|uniref:hypothetical protein n=1 Tax=Nocardia exalbida TaxID=290231 RepID=UPI0012F6DF16|nr:hypothetical protein [Nocardia exalbida]
MASVKGMAVRWVADDQPGIIEVQLTDAEGVVHSLIDKLPIFDGTEDLGPGSTYPVPVEIEVDLVEPIDGGNAVVDLRWGAVNTDRVRFVVPSVDLTL